MSQTRGGCVVILFLLAVLAVGALGVAILYGWGYRAEAPVHLLLPAAAAMELALYLLVATRRMGRLALWGWPLGLAARAVMAAGAAAVWPAAEDYAGSFVVYFGSYWIAVAVQVLLAAFVVWFVADMSAGPEVQFVEGAPAARTAGGRRALLDELVGARRPAEGRGGEEPRPPQGRREMQPAIQPTPETLAAGDAAQAEDTSELPAVEVEEPPAAAGDEARAVIAAAVADALSQATGLRGFRSLGDSGGVGVVANLDEGADAPAALRACVEMTAAAWRLADAALLGEPLALAVLLRAGGGYVVPTAAGLAMVSAPAPDGLGQLVAAARRAAARLGARWPRQVEVQWPAVSPGEPAAPAVDQWAASAAQQAAWHVVEGCGLVVTVSSAGSRHSDVAAAAGLIWQAAADLGRLMSAGGPRRIVMLCGDGAAALGAVRMEGAAPFVVVRAASAAQAGLVVAELERIAALCSQ